MYNSSFLNDETKNIDFKVQIFCSDHLKQSITNICTNQSCSNKKLQCYLCLQERKKHYLEHQESIICLPEYFRSLLNDSAKIIIENAELSSSSEHAFTMNSFKNLRDKLNLERKIIEKNFFDLNEFLYSKISELKIKYLDFHKKRVENFNKINEIYENFYKKVNNSKNLISKYGDFKKTLNKFQNLQSDKAEKIIFDILWCQNIMFIGKNELKNSKNNVENIEEEIKDFKILTAKNLDEIFNNIESKFNKNNKEYLNVNIFFDIINYFI